jgi:hypothetical protein
MRGNPGLNYSLIDYHNDWTGKLSAIIQVYPQAQFYCRTSCYFFSERDKCNSSQTGKKNSMLQPAMNDVDRTLTVTIETVDIIVATQFSISPEHIYIAAK